MPETPIRSPAPLKYPVQVLECGQSEANSVSIDERLFILQDYTGRKVAIKSPMSGIITSILVTDGEILQEPVLLCFVAADDGATLAQSKGATETNTHQAEIRDRQYQERTVDEQQSPDEHQRAKNKQYSTPSISDDVVGPLFTVRFFATLFLSIPIAIFAVDFFWNYRWIGGGIDLPLWDLWGSIRIWDISAYLVFLVALPLTWITIAGLTMDLFKASEGEAGQAKPIPPHEAKERHRLARRRASTSHIKSSASNEVSSSKSDRRWIGLIFLAIHFALGFAAYLVWLEIMSAWLNTLRPSQKLIWSIVYNAGAIGIFVMTVSLAARRPSGIVKEAALQRYDVQLVTASILSAILLFLLHGYDYPNVSNFTGFGAEDNVTAVLKAPLRTAEEQSNFEAYFLEGLDQ